MTRTVQRRMWFTLGVVLLTALSSASSADAKARLMKRVGRIEVSGLVTDGVRYAAWGRYDRTAPVPAVTIFDARTAKTRHVTLPAGCVPQSASAGTLLARCLSGPPYTMDLSTGELSELTTSVPDYVGYRMGRRWIEGGLRVCNDAGAACEIFVNRATGDVVRKVWRSGVFWDLDATPLRRLRHCGRYTTTPQDPRGTTIDGDLAVVDRAIRDPKTRRLLVRRCAGRPLPLEGPSVANVNVKRSAVVWSTGCELDFVDPPRCQPLVRARRMTTGRTTTWRFAGADKDGGQGISLDVDQLQGWVFVLRPTRFDSDSGGDPHAWALYRARIPR